MSALVKYASSLNTFSNCISISSSFHTTALMAKHRNVRKGLKVPKLTEKHIQVLKNMNTRRPYWFKPPIVPSSPLARTLHPVNQFAEEDRKIQEEILAKSVDDEPIDPNELQDIDDPYCREPMKCILCPKRYAVDYVVPSWKNPKLLAQFISPHTGLTYQKHITGLCESMQQEVERQVKRAQSMGYLATEIKEVHYLKDPPLFDSARPKRKNPF